MEFINTPTPLQQRKIDIITTGFGAATRYIKPLFFTEKPVPEMDTSKFTSSFTRSTLDQPERVLGKSVFTDVTLESDAYETEYFDSKSNSFKKAKLDPVKITLDTVLIDVSLTKNIVKTQINGQTGTVKEYYSKGDYDVTLRGAIVNQKGYNFPYTEFTKLLKLVDVPVSVKVTSESLSLFPIYNLSLESASYPQKEGSTNTQLFEINCVSDLPVESIELF